MPQDHGKLITKWITAIYTLLSPVNTYWLNFGKFSEIFMEVIMV
jgi:hypothetical protein